MPDRIALKPALPSSAYHLQMELVLAEHLARYAHSLVGCGRLLEAQEAIRKAGAAQLRALKGSQDWTHAEMILGR